MSAIARVFAHQSVLSGQGERYRFIRREVSIYHRYLPEFAIAYISKWSSVTKVEICGCEVFKHVLIVICDSHILPSHFRTHGPRQSFPSLIGTGKMVLLLAPERRQYFHVKCSRCTNGYVRDILSSREARLLYELTRFTTQQVQDLGKLSEIVASNISEMLKLSRRFKSS